MDSRELFDIISPYDRSQADGLMLEILKWANRAVPPEYVYTPEQLGEWAMRNGYRRGSDADLCALLKRTQEYVVRGTPLSQEITDALASRRSIYGM